MILQSWCFLLGFTGVVSLANIFIFFMLWLFGAYKSFCFTNIWLYELSLQILKAHMSWWGQLLNWKWKCCLGFYSTCIFLFLFFLKNFYYYFLLSHHLTNFRYVIYSFPCLLTPKINNSNNNKKHQKKVMLWFLTHFPSSDSWGQRLFLLFYLAISSFMEVSINLSFALVFSPFLIFPIGPWEVSW